jgi:hypothetical protein
VGTGSVGDGAWLVEGADDGFVDKVGIGVNVVGARDGVKEGRSVGTAEGWSEGIPDGASEGAMVGILMKPSMPKMSISSLSASSASVSNTVGDSSMAWNTRRVPCMLL